MKTRVFLLLLGAVLVLWGAGLPMVLWLGAEAPGTVTQVRRQLGDRGEAIPNRYTYTIAYEFRLPNGQMAQGHTQRVGDFFAPRDMAVGKPVRVRYLPGAPWLNEIPAVHWAAGLERAIVIVVGAGLVALAFRQPKTMPGPGRRSRRPG